MSSKIDIKRLDSILSQIESKMQALYGQTYKQALQIKQVREAIAAGQTFKWMDNPGALKQFEDMLAKLSRNTTLLMQSGVTMGAKKGTSAAAKETDEELEKDEEADLAKQVTDEHRAKGKQGFTSFTLNNGDDRLSDNVWELTKEGKAEMEIILQNGIKQGLTADQIAQSIQGYLKNPKSLYRRVRDKETGLLELSEAAKQYHPGPGVYRSAYQNALRLAQTEINAAYMRAEQERYRDDPQVIGIRVQKSNNHTTKYKGKVIELNDMCDHLQGDYPKTFVFVGWHPNCRCFIMPILAKPKDVREGKAKPVTQLPEGFKQWIADNQQKVVTARKTPYFVRNNTRIISNQVKGLDASFYTFLDEQPTDGQPEVMEQQQQPDAELEKLEELLRRAKQDPWLTGSDAIKNLEQQIKKLKDNGRNREH